MSTNTFTGGMVEAATRKLQSRLESVRKNGYTQPVIIQFSIPELQAITATLASRPSPDRRDVVEECARVVKDLQREVEQAGGEGPPPTNLLTIAEARIRSLSAGETRALTDYEKGVVFDKLDDPNRPISQIARSYAGEAHGPATPKEWLEELDQRDMELLARVRRAILNQQIPGTEMWNYNRLLQVFDVLIAQVGRGGPVPATSSVKV